MQHQPIVKRDNETHEWAHRPYQLLIIAACTNTGGKMKGSHSRAADRCPFVLGHSLSQVTSFMQLGMLWNFTHLVRGPWHGCWCLVQVFGVWSCFATMEHSRANAGLSHIATYLRWEVSGGFDRQGFPELSPGHAASCGNGIVTAHIGAQQVTQVAEGALHIKHHQWCHWHPLRSQFCRRWAGTWHHTCGRHSLGWPPVVQWCHCTSSGPTTCTVSTRWSCCRHHYSRHHRGTCQISLGHHGQH